MAEAKLQNVRRLLAKMPVSAVKAVREQRGMSQSELVARVAELATQMGGEGVKQGVLSDLERGRRSLTPDMADQLGPALGIEADKLLAMDVLGDVKLTAMKSADDLDPHFLVELIEYLDAVLPENDDADELLTAFMELAQERLAEYQARLAQRAALKSAYGEEERRDSLGRRRRKPYGLRKGS